MEDLVNEIKSTAHWRVNIRPTKFKKEKIGRLSDIKEVMEKCIVNLRGWPYPYFTREEISNGIDYVEGKCDWKGIKEYWRFYQSAQFIHHFSLFENSERGRIAIAHSAEPIGSKKDLKGSLSIFSTLFKMTEIYEFSIRLAQKGIFEKGVYISIILRGIRNHRLIFFGNERFTFAPYISNIDEIPLESTLGVEELITKGHDRAIKDTIFLFERFNWDSPPIGILKEQQKKLLERRL
ncbi:hypothetical protein ES703_122690 [subsurface metagenome]